MTTEELAEMFVPVRMRWRHIKPGDVIVGHLGGLLHVVETGRVARGTEVYPPTHEPPEPVDPDEAVTVLLPAALRDAMELTRDQLGARLLERRAAA